MELGTLAPVSTTSNNISQYTSPYNHRTLQTPRHSTTYGEIENSHFHKKKL